MPVESPLRSGADRTFGLIETLRYEPGHGCIRAAQHLARMAASAEKFGKAFDYDNAAARLNAVSGDTPLRVRLYLDEADSLSLTTHPFQPLAAGKTWIVAIATTKLEAGNTLLAHKTTLRDAYNEARAEFDPTLIDEVLLTNQHGQLCEGTITNLFVQKGANLVTPALDAGLLQGVLRQELLETKQAVEGVITTQDLSDYPFFVGNSLRGLISAKLYESKA
jgi:4-amino-4-deoxychorismate lyase